MPIREINVKTWEEFEQEVRVLRAPKNRENMDPLPLFRGQENSDWPLHTTLDRTKQRGMLFAEYFRRISKIRPEIESFTDRKWKLLISGTSYAQVGLWGAGFNPCYVSTAGDDFLNVRIVNR